MRHAIDHHRLLQGAVNAFQQWIEIAHVVKVLEHQHKLVAALARHIVPIAQRRAHAIGDLAEHHVAGGVTVAVVERLQVVDIEHADGDQALLPGRPVQHAFEVPVQRASVGQMREVVVQGQIGLARLLLEQHAALVMLLERQARRVGNFV